VPVPRPLSAWAPAGLVAAVAGLVACAVPGRPPAAGAESTVATALGAELTVYAAASLTDAVDALAAAYGAARPGTTFTVSTGASSALRTQIEQGAPADVLLAADTENPEALVDAGIAHGDAVAFAAVRLTVIVPVDNPAGIQTPIDLARPGLTIIAAGAEVPITRYAEQVVANLGSLPGYPGDFADRYRSNVASREEDVRAIVAKLSLGEGDAGIVYLTDARAASGIATLEIPEEANVRATYAAVVVGRGRNTDASRGFVEWLIGPTAQAILAEHGFEPPP